MSSTRSVSRSTNSAPEPADLLAQTRLLNYADVSLQRLVQERGWQAQPEYERIGSVYDFVRNEIRFGYNAVDDLPAARVLADGYGQCNTKSTLLMALLRACGIPCRLHGFTIHKALQKGAVTGLAYALAPQEILHSWVEVWHGGRWVILEGFILDDEYLRSLQGRFPGHQAFCGYGASTPNLQAPPVEWKGEDTFIQKEGIARDLGVYSDPDEFYAQHGGNLRPVAQFAYAYFFRHRMNANVQAVRAAKR